MVLDEPTNHLDMHSKDFLLDALKNYGGTVIFVSHDRGFIEGLATRVIELTPGRSRNFPGNYSYYLERLEAESNGSVGEFSFGTKASPVVDTKVKPVNITKTEDENKTNLSWEEEKKLKAERRKLEKDVEK